MNFLGYSPFCLNWLNRAKHPMHVKLDMLISGLYWHENTRLRRFWGIWLKQYTALAVPKEKLCMRCTIANVRTENPENTWKVSPEEQPCANNCWGQARYRQPQENWLPRGNNYNKFRQFPGHILWQYRQELQRGDTPPRLWPQGAPDHVKPGKFPARVGMLC